MLVIAGNLRLGAQGTRRAYLGSTLVFAAEQTRWGTDFSEYSTGVAPSDWTSIASSHLETWEITSGGLISDNRMRIRQAKADSPIHFSHFLWDAVPEVGDSEFLLLISRGTSATANHQVGAVQRFTGTTFSSHQGVFLGARNNVEDVTFRRVTNGFQHDWVAARHGGTFDAGAALWVRGRWEGTNYRVKGWIADTGKEDLGLSDEPSSWQINNTYGTVTGVGRIGVAHGVFSSTPAQSETFVHYFGVGIDGDSAPLPVFVPDRAPAPIPGPAPEPGTFETFDSTATSFDSTAHTFDEVA